MNIYMSVVRLINDAKCNGTCAKQSQIVFEMEDHRRAIEVRNSDCVAIHEPISDLYGTHICTNAIVISTFDRYALEFAVRIDWNAKSTANSA